MKRLCYYGLIICLTAIFFSCQSEDEFSSSNIGYLYLNIGESQNVNTKAVSENYNPKQIAVQIIDDNNQVVKETDDWTTWEGEQIALKPGAYTIKASSSGFDGKDSGFDIPYYAGAEPVTIEKGKAATAKVLCSLANVKFTVKYDPEFLEKFEGRKITVQVGDQSGTYSPVNFTETESRSAYMPEGKLYAKISINNPENEDKPYTLEQKLDDAKARDHFILNYKLQETGKGNISVTVDPKTHEYNYTFTVSPEAVAGANLSANVWTTVAYLKAENVQGESGADLTGLKFQYRVKGEGDETWKDVETSEEAVEDQKVYKAKVTGLTAKTTYQYRLINDKGFESDIAEMVTEEAVALYNGNMDLWYQSGKTWYAGESGKSFWDSSNPGTTQGAAAMVNKNPTTGVKSPVYTEGELSQSACLKSMFISVDLIFTKIEKFAAASLYTGSFGELVGTSGAKINFGQPFTARPISLHGFFQYAPVKIDHVGGNQPAGTVGKGDDDVCSIYIALAKKTYTVDNTNTGTFIQFETDPNIIAYGELPLLECVNTNGQWKEFTIPLKYKNLDEKPTHIIIVASSSKYGDYFTGGAGSIMYLDDMSLVYEGEPALWE